MTTFAPSVRYRVLMATAFLLAVPGGFLLLFAVIADMYSPELQARLWLSPSWMATIAVVAMTFGVLAMRSATKEFDRLRLANRGHAE